jgi:hypothetical protein
VDPAGVGLAVAAAVGNKNPVHRVRRPKAKRNDAEMDELVGDCKTEHRARLMKSHAIERRLRSATGINLATCSQVVTLRAHAVHFFNAAVQLTSTVTGGGSTPGRGWLIKNRWPSVVTRY